MELWTALADPQDPQDQAGLAAAWTNLSNRLIDLGRMEEAAAAAQRSVAVHPAESPDRANALNSLAITLRQLGRHEQARDTETEAIRLFDAIETGTGLTPQHRTHLASTLCNRADSHSMLGDDMQAAADAGRAVQIFYEQWSAEPAPHGGYLLRALRKKLEYCAQAGDGQSAVDAATLQVRVLRARRETGDRQQLAAGLRIGRPTQRKAEPAVTRICRRMRRSTRNAPSAAVRYVQVSASASRQRVCSAVRWTHPPPLGRAEQAPGIRHRCPTEWLSVGRPCGTGGA